MWETTTQGTSTFPTGLLRCSLCNCCGAPCCLMKDSLPELNPHNESRALGKFVHLSASWNVILVLNVWRSFCISPRSVGGTCSNVWNFSWSVVKILNHLHLHVGNIDHRAVVQFCAGEAAILIDRWSGRLWLANAAMHHVVTCTCKGWSHKGPRVNQQIQEEITWWRSSGFLLKRALQLAFCASPLSELSCLRPNFGFFPLDCHAWKITTTTKKETRGTKSPRR